MSKEPMDFIRHIFDECNYIVSVCSQLTREKFVEDDTMKRAIARSLEIIGEASKKVPADFKYKWNMIQWRNMASMRDRLIHEYHGINYAIVWDVAENKIPELLQQIREVLESE